MLLFTVLQLKEESLMHFGRAMELNHYMKALSVAHNQIESPGVQHFAAALRKHGSCRLEKLDIR